MKTLKKRSNDVTRRRPRRRSGTRRRTTTRRRRRSEPALMAVWVTPPAQAVPAHLVGTLEYASPRNALPEPLAEA